ncbi:MAG: hypothetical protein HUU56_03175 [Bdellovibrionaceae bacterium]|nr:hypothetical protein [Pseudobdellovibrionaceae bacterium]
MFTILFTLTKKNRNKVSLFFVSLVVICTIRFEAICSEIGSVDLSKSVKVINVFSGAPQAIDGPSKYAGFGDIAANLVASSEIKSRYPDKKVRLIVTSAFNRIDPLIPTTDEIVKIMAPQLDPSKKGVVQMYGDVEVVFIPVDFKKALQINSMVSYYWELFKLKLVLPSHIPTSDLNLNFSAYPGGEQVLRMNTKVAIGVEEHYGDSNLVNLLYPFKSTRTASVTELTSGPFSTGFMLTFNRPNSEQSINLIREWSESNGKVVPSGDFLPQIAYSAGWRSIQIYIDALSKLEQPEKPIVLFVKDFPELNFKNLPKSVTVIPVKGLPHEVMSALIQESYFSPLVTGDISYGQALSSVRSEGKSLIYESPEWKVESAFGTKKLIAKDLKVDASLLDPMFMLTEELDTLDLKGLNEKASKLAIFLNDKELQIKISKSIINRQESWDIIGNIFKIANHLIDDIGTQGLKNIKGSRSRDSLKSNIQLLFGKGAQCVKYYD